MHSNPASLTFRIDSLPQILFAHRYSCSRGSWHLSPGEDIVEISVCLAGEMRRSDGKTTECFVPGELFVTPHDRHYTVEVPDEHTHITVALRLQKSGTAVLLPSRTAVSVCPEALRALRKLAAAPLPSLTASAAALTLLATLDSSVRAFQKVENPHYTKALRCMSDHLCTATLAYTADFVGVSPGYLATLFRRHGTTFTEHLNALRISRVGELIAAKGLTAQQAGERVGIGDPKYLSRLFRKYNGVSIRDFRAALPR